MAHRLQEIRPSGPWAVGSQAPIEEGHLLQTFLETTPDHVYFKDLEGRFIRLSASLARWVGVEDARDALGMTDFDFFAEEHASAARRGELEIMRTEEPIVGLEEREVWPDGRLSWVSTTKVPLYDRERRVIGIFGLSRDISARKLSEERELEQAEKLAALADELEQLSLRDGLTGLYNRRGFQQLGDAAVGHAHRRDVGVCVLFCDVDGLKAINDGFGHAAGDRALVAVAANLRQAMRSTDVVGRIGGDEFAAVVIGLSRDEIERLCERVRMATAACSPSEHPLSVSIGVSRFCVRRPVPLEKLLAEADRAMYDERNERRHSRLR